MILLFLLVGCQEKQGSTYPQIVGDPNTNPQNTWAELYSGARILLERGDDFAAAIQKVDQGLRETEKKDSLWNWKFRVLKSEILLWEAKAGEVLSLLAGSPPPEFSTGEFAVRTKMAQGLALDDFNKYAEAERQLKEAEEIAIATAPEMLSGVALCKGLVAFKQNDFASAQKYYLIAIQFAREYQNSFVEANALSNSGMVFTKTNHFDQAIDRFSESLAFAHSRGYKQQEWISASNLAWSYLELGDYEKSIANYSQQEKVIESSGVAELRGNAYGNAGEAYFAQGNYATARKYFQKAYEIASEIHRRRHSDQSISMADDLNALAEVDLGEGHLDDAENYNGQALALRPQTPALVLTSAKIGIAKRQFADSERLLKRIISNDRASKSVHWYAQAELANLYMAANRRAEAEKQFQLVIAAFDNARASIQDDENRMAFSLRAARVCDDYVGLLVEEKKNLKALQVAEFNRARTLAEGLGLARPARSVEIQLSSLQNILKRRHQVVFAYRLAAKQSYLWVITDAQSQLFMLPARNEIAKQVDRYRDMLLGAEDVDEGMDLGQALYKILIQPAEKLIPKGSGVLLVPDGSLYRLNFETLVVPGTSPHYWIDDVELENVSSLQLLTLTSDRKSPRYERLLLVGAPIPTKEYPVLAHAEDEMSRVAKHFSNSQETTISGKDATPSAYQNSHPEQFGVIHFVTHGVASETSPLESAIILSPQGVNPFKLYARSIINTRLHADLVTISACSGAGRRDYSGEGLVGLAWGFLRAGAHHVVAGLWEVDDAAEPELMDRFYSELGNNKSPANSLRLAKLAMLHSDSVYRKPYYWASLQLYTGS